MMSACVAFRRNHLSTIGAIVISQDHEVSRNIKRRFDLHELPESSLLVDKLLTFLTAVTAMIKWL